MIEFIKYNNTYKEIVKGIYNKETLDKFTNSGIYIYVYILGLFKSSIYLVVHNQELIGTIAIIRKFNIRKLKKETWIAGVHILQKFRRQSYGTKLMLLSLNECEKNRYKIVNLYVDKDNIAAYRLYEKIGFTITGTYKSYWKMHYIIN